MARVSKLDVLMLSEDIEAVYSGVVDQLIRNIARHFKSGHAWDTAKWELRKIAELEAVTAENAKIINTGTKAVPKKIVEAIAKVSGLALSDIETLIQKAIAEGALDALHESRVGAVLEDMAGQAIDQANLVNTVMLDSSKTAFLQVINDTVFYEEQALFASEKSAILREMGEYTYSVASGAETRTQALRRAISNMADRGIYGFVDRGGHHWSPEAYINMDIRTTLHNTAIQSIKRRQEDFGSDIFQVSTHAGARPLCYPYQGKFYSWGGDEGEFTDGRGRKHRYKSIRSTSYGEPAGLFGINCGHYPLPQIPRVTIPSDGRPEPKNEDEKEYNESQKQRALERSIREAKRKQLAYETAGLDDAAKDMGKTIRQRQAAMREFVDQTGRARRYDRESIGG